MNIFKLRVSDHECFPLTKEIFEKETRLETPWYNHDIKERHFAVCPACNNSTQVIHLYDEAQTTHAKHNLRVNVGRQNKDTLNYCPFYSGKPILNVNHRRKKEDDTSKEIKQLLIDNFDKVCYFINKKIGLRMPPYKLERMLSNYKTSQGWLYSGANLINIPWIFLYQIRSQQLSGFGINNEKIRAAIKRHHPRVAFNKYNNMESTDPLYHRLSICFIHHKRTIEHHQLKESLLMLITDDKDVEIYRETIDFDHDHFVNLLNSEDERYRKMDQVNLARNVLS